MRRARRRLETECEKGADYTAERQQDADGPSTPDKSGTEAVVALVV